MQLNSNLSEAAIQRWQILKDSIHQNLNSFTQSVQETATQTTDNTKATLENNWHSLEKITNTTSGVMQNAINTSVHDWLSKYPVVLKVLEIFTWGINHPVRGVIILLFIIALLWSIIKAIVKLIETASWSLLKIPFILLQKSLKSLWIVFGKYGNLRIKPVTDNQLNDDNSEGIKLISTNIYPDKQQRLAEITYRLEVIHNEQQALLKEANELIKSDSQKIITNINDQERFI
ncbi:hypothetical protein FJR38_04215 [Anabaena sp. UHCC 0253]|uniref:hypothetical protein n=1 Tax=Anabaena sp. UHCC 0253 TaxID=2590019 RepID=UPI0014476752|nr:hypothetical protein [Anabaena sp. UHCC 0253]MTJ51933.1 hypothetical protein [Anabaena sp. UHCC 0253]